MNFRVLFRTDKYEIRQVEVVLNFSTLVLLVLSL